MKILIFSWRDPKHPLAGGAEQVVHEHAKGWIKVGHNVTLFASRFRESRESEKLDGVEIIRRGSHYLGVQVAGFLYYMKNKKNFDFIIDQFHGLPFFTPLYVRKPKLALIQETAEKVWFLNPLPKPLNWIVGILGFIFEPFILLLYKNTYFMTGSESAKKDLVKFGISGKKIIAIPHGVLVKRPVPFPNKESTKVIVYLGVVSKDKGIEDALKCFSILSKNYNLQFWVIGKPETEKYGKSVKRLAQKLGLGNKVKFWGYVSEKLKFDLLARSHILINPSFREGWGLVNIEANSVGLPVIAYKSAGLTDSVKDNISGIICRKNSPEDLAKRVGILVKDHKRYLMLRRGAITWARNFNWEKSTILSLNLISKVKALLLTNSHTNISKVI